MSKDLRRALKAVAAGMADDDSNKEVALEGEIMRPARQLTTIPSESKAVIEGEAVRSTDLMTVPDDDWDAYDFFMVAEASAWFSDVKPSTVHDEGRTHGFCAGCGAHHVRAAGKMLCVECDIDFRDMG
jgi:hypothetical protein